MTIPNRPGIRVEQVVFHLADGEELVIAVEPEAHEHHFLGKATITIRGELPAGQSLEFSPACVDGTVFIQFWRTGRYTIEADGEVVDQQVG